VAIHRETRCESADEATQRHRPRVRDRLVIMFARPGVIKKIIEVPFGRPAAKFLNRSILIEEGALAR
jgi:hypothetical protein